MTGSPLPCDIACSMVGQFSWASSPLSAILQFFPHPGLVLPSTAATLMWLESFFHMKKVPLILSPAGQKLPVSTFIPLPIWCLKSQLLSNPFLGCFILSWSVWDLGKQRSRWVYTTWQSRAELAQSLLQSLRSNTPVLGFSLLPHSSSSPPSRSPVTLRTETNLEVPETVESGGSNDAAQFLAQAAKGTQPGSLSPKIVFHPNSQPLSNFLGALYSGFPGCGPQCACTHSLATLSRAW